MKKREEEKVEEKEKDKDAKREEEKDKTRREMLREEKAEKRKDAPRKQFILYRRIFGSKRPPSSFAGAYPYLISSSLGSSFVHQTIL